MQHAVPVMPNVAAAPMALPRALGRLDRDHVGAQIGQRLDAHRTKQKMVEADDANALQKIEHVTSAKVCALCARGGARRKRERPPNGHRGRWARLAANALHASVATRGLIAYSSRNTDAAWPDGRKAMRVLKVL